ncbi:hypothetical protein GMB80_12075 [Turicibacter sanguinis]|nr:hypothetical protein [Turicibacter sanguinis]
MNDNLNKIIEALQKIRSDVRSSTSRTIMDVSDKYEMIFIGEKFRLIHVEQLTKSLNNVFKLKITHEEVLELLPIACSKLGMRLEELVSIDNPTNSTYLLHLFDL